MADVVLGTGGFIGSRLTKRLNAEGASPTVLRVHRLARPGGPDPRRRQTAGNPARIMRGLIIHEEADSHGTTALFYGDRRSHRSKAATFGR